MANLTGFGLIVWVRRKKALRFEGLAVVSMVGWYLRWKDVLRGRYSLGLENWLSVFGFDDMFREV
jgi:hypothetical protein